MIKLNLLPPEEKKEIEFDSIDRWFLFFYLKLIGIALVFITLCVTLYLYLLIIIKSQQGIIASQQSDEKSQQLQQVEETIKKMNGQIIKIEQLQDKFICWVPVLEELAQAVPTGVSLENFLVQNQNLKINLNGHADTRDHFLTFKNNLESSQLFVEIDNPLSNLVKKGNLNFNLSFKISTSTQNTCLIK